MSKNSCEYVGTETNEPVSNLFLQVDRFSFACFFFLHQLRYRLTHYLEIIIFITLHESMKKPPPPPEMRHPDRR